MKNSIFVIIFVQFLCYSQFAGGSGTAEDPWLIRTPENLDSIRYYLGTDNDDKHFKQIADIDLGISTWNEGSGWEPIGRDSSYVNNFQGSFDGNGYKIMNLYINRPDENYIGLFGILYSTTEIRRVCLQNIDVTGRNKVGGLSGLTYVVSIYESIVAGSILGDSDVGGLIGDSKCVLILNSYNTASVTGIKNIGGLIGIAVPEIWNQIEKSYSTGSVTGTENTGGLFGYSENINLRSCYWDIEKSGQNISAGGEGRTTDEMTYDHTGDTYKYWDFNDIWIEDFEGVNNGYPFLQNQISSLTPSAPSNLKADSQNGEFSVELSWNNPDTLLNGDGITELTSIIVYRNFDLIHSIVNPTPGNLETFTDIVPATGNYIYKVFAVNSEGYGINARIDQPAGNLFAYGYGTEEQPYIISSAEELNNVRYFTKKDSVYFLQIANIDLGITPWNIGKGWEPIGDYENEFKGNYSGESRYNNIMGLTINDSTKYYASLFGVIQDAEIDHVHIQDVNITGLAACGALTGASINSNITNCSSEDGAITGCENEIGGLIGTSMNDSISCCFSTVSVEGLDHIGGLIGINIGSPVNDCYSQGSVTGYDYIGGMIGVNDENPSIKNCYSTGLVTGNSSTGGFMSGFSNGTVHCYWDIETSGQTTSIGGEGRMTEDMILPFSDSTYVDWDFMSIWEQGWPTKISYYPILKWQTFSSIEQDYSIPAECELFQNYPNPFNPATEISFALQKKGNVKLMVFNSKGELVRTLVDGKKNNGSHSVNFNASDLNSGLYFYKLTTDETSVTRKMLLLK